MSNDGAWPGPKLWYGANLRSYDAGCETCGWHQEFNTMYERDDEAQRHPCQVRWLTAQLKAARSAVAGSEVREEWGVRDASGRVFWQHATPPTAVGASCTLVRRTVSTSPWSEVQP